MITLTQTRKKKICWVNRPASRQARYRIGWPTRAEGRRQGPSEALRLVSDHQQKPSTFHRAGLGSLLVSILPPSLVSRKLRRVPLAGSLSSESRTRVKHALAKQTLYTAFRRSCQFCNSRSVWVNLR